jgi:hypothetical protein
MAISLYDVSVTPYLQTLGAVSGILDRGLTHCQDKGIDPAELVETRLVPNMLPLHFQIVSVAHHSLGAIECVMAGVSGPPASVGPLDYAGLQQLVADSITGLKALSADEVNGLEGRDVTFQMPGLKIPFTAENYLLSFALPNLHFHATTAYDILRTKGVALGKRDYLGQLRTKG